MSRTKRNHKSHLISIKIHFNSPASSQMQKNQKLGAQSVKMSQKTYLKRPFRVSADLVGGPETLTRLTVVGWPPAARRGMTSAMRRSAVGRHRCEQKENIYIVSLIRRSSAPLDSLHARNFGCLPIGPIPR